MKKKTKERNWLYQFYKENIMYIWVVVGIIVVSGFSIGMSIGKLADKNSNIVLDNSDNGVNNSNRGTIINDISMIDKQNANVQKDNKVNDKDNENENENDINQGNVGSNVVEENSNKEVNIDTTTRDDFLRPSVETTSNNVEPPVVKEEKKLEFIIPVQGDIIKEYTVDTLVYSNTLQAFINHEGIDIESQLAQPVKAIEDGKVIEVKNDPRYGYIIIIDHGQGYESVYCNLSTLDMVYVGKEVEKGQVISGIGNTALFEVKDNPHLHFELIKDGKIVNPLEYIK